LASMIPNLAAVIEFTLFRVVTVKDITLN